MEDFKNKFLLAPMAGFTDCAFRYLCLSAGAGFCVTEMVSAKGLVYGSENTKELLECLGCEDKTAVQLFGAEPEFFEKAVVLPEIQKFPIIDINMGCPVPKVVKQGAGSQLMTNLPLASKIIETTVLNSKKPVTVKFRLGWDKDSINAVDFAKMCESSGASAITVHGRTREQMYSGTADWDMIKKVANSVKIPVIGNGDINSVEVAKERLENYDVASIAIGRGALGNPWLFADLTGTDFCRDPLEVIKQHFSLVLKFMPESRAVPLMRGQLNFYTKALGLGPSVRNQINRLTDLTELFDILKNCIN